MYVLKKVFMIFVCVFLSFMLWSCGSSENYDDGYYEDEELFNSSFTVKFVNWDGTLLYETQVRYGEDAVYVGSTPIKEATELESYEFMYFTDSTYIKKDTTCVAVYKSSTNINSEYYTNLKCTYERYGEGYRIKKFYDVIDNKKDPNLVNKKLVMPSMHEGLPVVAIGEYAGSSFFISGDGMKYMSIELPKYLEEIGKRAFESSNFDEITFPSSLKKIEECAFYLSHFSSINLNEGLEYIGERAFYLGFISIDQTINITIPSTVTIIGEQAFSECYDKSPFNIYCKANSKPSGWHRNWNLIYIDSLSRTYYHNVYWGQ